MTFYQCLEEMEMRGYRAIYRFPLSWGHDRSRSISDEKVSIDNYGPDTQEAYIYQDKIVMPIVLQEKYFMPHWTRGMWSYEPQLYSILAAECRK